MQSINLCVPLWLFTLLVVICSLTNLYAQHSEPMLGNSFHEVDFVISSYRDTTFRLPHQFIISGTEIVMLDSISLQSKSDYVLNSRFGFLYIPSKTLKSFVIDTNRNHLHVWYRAFPFDFRETYRHRKSIKKFDSITGRHIQVAKSSPAFAIDDLFGSRIHKSGSIVRGFSFGSFRDLSLNSGFRMQMSGNITDDLELIAALTDENTPIQPEGTTQTLQEVDKVFVELRGPSLSGMLGDFNLKLDGSEFGILNRKVRGAKGHAKYNMGKMKGDIIISGSSTRGKFTTNEFLGRDGVQGPYRLMGQNNNHSIIVIAGTERVYINGELMTRGENNDYVIDYALAELSFTPRRLIFRGSRIVVDFEYSDRYYNRNLFAVQTKTNFFNNTWSFNASFFRENDDENSPIDVTLNEEEKEILRKAGDDQFKAFRSGVDSVGAGRGHYIQMDTLVRTSSGIDSLVSIYRYNPADTAKALYLVFFSYVGSGKGDYSKVKSGYYEFIGLNQGSYAPVRFLPMPQAHVLTDFEMRGKLTDDITIEGEYSISSLDPNQVSSVDDGRHMGSALKFGLRYIPRNIYIGKLNVGSFDLSLKERFVSKRFAALDRTNEVEFNRNWNIIDSSLVDEELREGLMMYRPIPSLFLRGGFGWMKRGDPFTSKRYSFSGALKDENLPKINYDLEVINKQNTHLDLISNWIRQKSDLQLQNKLFTPYLRFSNEYLQNRSIEYDTLRLGSYRFNEIIPGISFNKTHHLSLDAEVGWRWEDSLAAGSLNRSSRIFIQHYSGKVREWQSFSSMFDLTVQNRKFTDLFRNRNNRDEETILLRWQSRLNPWGRGIESDWFYEVLSERAAKLERVFRQVPKGTGNYVYLGDVNDNNIVDAQDFQLSRFDADYISITLPTDELLPVVDVKSSARIRLNLSKFIVSESWIQKVLSTLSSETYVRVEEKSTERETRHIYFLHFSHFLNDQTTLAGSILMREDFYILENDPKYSLRLRYSQRKGLTQFAVERERTYNREQSVRFRWQLIPEIANQIDYIVRKDMLISNRFSNRIRNIAAQALILDWSYRPEQKIELGFKITLGNGTNFDSTEVNLNEQSARLIYSFDERGQGKVEFSREEVIFNQSGEFIPFQLTNGKIGGKSWLFHLGLDYRLTKYIQATMSYDGRSEGGRAMIHTARAEIRAFF